MNVTQLLEKNIPLNFWLSGGEMGLMDMEETRESLSKEKIELELDLHQMEEY